MPMRRVARWSSYGGGALAVLALSLYHSSQIADPPYSFTGTFRFGWAVGYSVLLGVTTYAVGLPDQPTRSRQAAWLALVAVALAAIGVSVPQLVLGDALLPRFVVFGAAAVMVPWQVLVNLLARDGRHRDQSRDRVLLVADPSEVDRLTDDLRLEPERGALLVATLTPQAAATPSGLIEAQLDSRASVVVLDRAAQSEESVITQAAQLHEGGVRVRTLQGFYEEWLGKLPLSELERASLFFDIGEIHRARYSRVTRVLDLFVALLGLGVLVLITPLVVLGDVVANRGPLFYRQTRVGKGGAHFTILKFRTMSIDADRVSHATVVSTRWTELDDPRITRFGGFLRRSHLDELPQVLNILRGDLSIVGPRPEQPHYVEELSEKLAFYDLRHLVRPGLTGWAQVKYGYAGDERDALEKLQYEFFYLRHQDLNFDLRIMLRTLRAIVGGQGSGR